MHYSRAVSATFVVRPNRFIAHVLVDGLEVRAHVRNTGRCRELLLPGAQVWLEPAADPQRSTQWSLIAVQKGDRLINMDSQAPNRTVEEALRGGWLPPCATGPAAEIRREYTWGNSRLDFLVRTGRQDLLMEVKGVTLEEDGVALFPDAPTQRGLKHLLELERAVQEGYAACALFVIQMEHIRHFSPNMRTHPAFGEALQQIQNSGVCLHAVICRVTPDSMFLSKAIPVVL